MPSPKDSANRNKKARVGLAFEIELALPFLSATEDLHHFAAVSKACRDAARESYATRKKTPIAMSETNSNSNTTAGIGKVFPLGKAPECYLKPWWLPDEQRREGYSAFGQYPLEFRDDNSWVLGEESLCLTAPPVIPTAFKLIFPATHKDLFDNGDTELVHWSLVDQRLLIILKRWTDRGRETYHAEETRQQLFAVVYELQSNKSLQDDEQLLPLFCQKLTEPLDRYNYGSLDGIAFGNAERSRKGDVIAVVTALPLGNEDNDDEIYRETAEVTVFDITPTSLNKRCVLEMPIGERTNESWLTMAISNGGELISINATQYEADSCFGDWRVYDITSCPAKAVVQKEEVEKHLLHHQFTPDDELLMVVPYQERPRSRGMPRDPNLNNPEAFFDDVEVPSWLAKRMISLIAKEREYYHQYE